MSRISLYLSLAVVGAIVPYIFFVQFFGAEGFGGNFIGALFVNGAAAGFSADVLLSSLVFWIYLFPEARRTNVGRPWVYVAVNLLIGLSCALPLFLWARERALASSRG
ncbi:MAG: DUF2834 domain-containing protein [Acidobacteriota bacterium]